MARTPSLRLPSAATNALSHPLEYSVSKLGRTTAAHPVARVMTLFNLRRRVLDSGRERDHFRAKHKIVRPARLSTPAKTVLKIGLLAVMLVVEIVVNGVFLSKSNWAGLLGGAVQAVTFAALNILVSFLCGLLLIRLINRREIFLKFLGFISLIAYLTFAVALNLTLSHLFTSAHSKSVLPQRRQFMGLLRVRVNFFHRRYGRWPDLYGSLFWIWGARASLD
jgi:hypothetical protein